MAGLNVPATREFGRGAARRSAPRFLLRWEDWLTLVPALMVYMAVAYAAREAEWVDGMPTLFPTTIMALLIGLLAARVRGRWWHVHPAAIAAGVVVVVLGAQDFATGETLFDRLSDFRFRMWAWIEVVRNGDVSNDDLPFVTLVHGIAFLAAYTAAWSIYRLQNAWLAIVPAGGGLLLIIATLDGQPGGAFVVFMVGALLLVSRLYLQKRQTHWERAGIEYPDFISLSVVQITLVLAVGLVTLAWLVPLGRQASAAEAIVDRFVEPITDRGETLARLFPGVRTGASSNFHTFGETLAIRGDVDLGTRVLAEIVTEQQGGFLRAASYDEYTGAGWRSTNRETLDIAADDYSLGGVDVEPYALREVTSLTVISRDGEDTLFSLGIPTGANVPTRVQGPESFPGDVERLRADEGISEGDEYVVTGSVSVATPDDLRGTSAAYPAWVSERYLQLPGSLPDRVREETARILGSATTPFDKAAAIESYLRELPFDLAVDGPPARGDVVDHLLFDLQRGYFDYLSTAMAVMLRTAGVPARPVVGYALDRDDLADGRYLMRKDDAYSWVEVYFPEYGWVTFNPTPTRPGTVEQLGGGVDSGLNGVPDFSDPILNADEFPLGFLDIPAPDDFPPGGEAPLDDGGNGGLAIPWTAIWVVIGIAGIVGAGALTGRIVWNWGLGGLDGTPRLWAKTQRLAGWANMASRDTETAREWSQRLGRSIEKDDEARTLREAYEREMYGANATAAPEAGPAYLQVRNALVSMILRRERGPRGSRDR